MSRSVMNKFLGVVFIVSIVSMICGYKIEKRAVHYSHDRCDQSIGPFNWPLLSPECGGIRQSPINIDYHSLEHLNLPKLHKENYDILPDSIMVGKNLHTVIVKPFYATVERFPRISGGPLHDSYALDHIHFHWGSRDDIGSEHSVDGKMYELEMHAVHISEKYSSMTEALSNADGLVVLAYLLQVGFEINTDLEWIVNEVTNLGFSDQKSIQNPAIPMSLLVPSEYNSYVLYEGSLTTPPCSEAVTWIIEPKPLPISYEQLNIFRELTKTRSSLRDNFRPIQKTNGRSILFVTSF